MAMNTNHRSQKFISSRRTESSEIQKRAIRLGKTLAKELGLGAGADSLSRWMAYYIAEQIAIAKKAKGEAKIKAEQQCFEVILKLWEHRSHLPPGMRPFESFDPIFRALDKLDPENEQPYFYRSQDSSKKNKSDKKSDGVEAWLNIARGIDQAARIWLEYVFQQAALSATDKKTITWLENAVSGSNRDEVSLIVRLIDAGMEDIGEIDKEAEKSKQDKLKSRIEKLDAFSAFSDLLRADLSNELQAMASKSPSNEKSAQSLSKRKSNNKPNSK